MKIVKAIEILDNYLRGDEPDYAPDLPLALKLGIKALKEVTRLRSYKALHVVRQLEGETKE